jgi:hypothetical protein
MKQLNQFVVMADYLAALLLPVAAAETPILPWQREIPLREAAKSVTIDETLNATQPGSRGVTRATNLVSPSPIRRFRPMKSTWIRCRN